MKITEDMLTEEYGFIKDEIVNVRIPRTDPNSKDWGLPFQWSKNDIPFLTSPEVLEVRVLTGPLSIWNHAPSWAEYLYPCDEDGLMVWEVSEEIDLWTVERQVTMIKRPWWARKITNGH